MVYNYIFVYFGEKLYRLLYICNYATYDKSHYSKHIESAKHFKNTHTLTNNKKLEIPESQNNNGEKTKRYKCEYCKNKFTTSSKKM